MTFAWLELIGFAVPIAVMVACDHLARRGR
jgi:hypothetical protein